MIHALWLIGSAPIHTKAAPVPRISGTHHLKDGQCD
jgi:hypothetical protein